MDEKTSINDAGFVKSAQKGDRSAFDQLVERYHDSLFGFIHGKIYDISTVEDIVQEAFLIAYRSLGNCKKPASFKSWLFSIAKFTAAKTIAKRKSHASLESVSENAIERREPATDEKAGRLAQLDEAIESLPEEMRRVITLKYQNQMTCEEIATRMRKPIGTIRTWLVRAQAKLRTFVKKTQ